MCFVVIVDRNVPLGSYVRVPKDHVFERHGRALPHLQLSHAYTHIRTHTQHELSIQTSTAREYWHLHITDMPPLGNTGVPIVVMWALGGKRAESTTVLAYANGKKTSTANTMQQAFS